MMMCDCKKYMNDPHKPGCFWYTPPVNPDPKPVKMGECDCGSAKGGGGHYNWCGSTKPAARVDPIRAAEDFIDAWGRNADEYFVVACNNVGRGAYCVDKSPTGAGKLWVGPKHLSYPTGLTASQFFPGDLVRLAP